MKALEFKILNKKQELTELLRYALGQVPVFLPIVKTIKFEIQVCDRALKELYSHRTSIRSG